MDPIPGYLNSFKNYFLIAHKISCGGKFSKLFIISKKKGFIHK
jgi:hypothetical protein